jgi:hypothetical protein
MRFPRFSRKEPPPEPTCPRRGVPAPVGTVECTACGWDLRDAYHDPLADEAPETARN